MHFRDTNLCHSEQVKLRTNAGLEACRVSVPLLIATAWKPLLWLPKLAICEISCATRPPSWEQPPRSWEDDAAATAPDTIAAVIATSLPHHTSTKTSHSRCLSRSLCFLTQQSTPSKLSKTHPTASEALRHSCNAVLVNTWNNQPRPNSRDARLRQTQQSSQHSFKIGDREDWWWRLITEQTNGQHGADKASPYDSSDHWTALLGSGRREKPVDGRDADD